MNRHSPSILQGLFRVALAAADPARCLPPHLPPAPRGRLRVVGAGKAAAAMAQAVESFYPPGTVSGLVVVPYGHGRPCRAIEVVEAAHPLPDAASERAAERLLAVLRGLTVDDRVLVLLSGGGSSLLCRPAGEIRLAEKQALQRQLLASGAAIAEINCVRKHLSAIKGGRLALAAQPAPLLTLAISDVPGNDPAVIASGPTVPDPTTRAEALAILQRYAIEMPASVRDWLDSPRSETPKPGAPGFERNALRVIASGQDALSAAAQAAREQGIAPLVLGDAIEGEAREVARVMAGIARACARHGTPVAPPCVLLGGGETTVTLGAGASAGQGGREGCGGRGGRNGEFLLALALALEGAPGIHAIACDTDGIDGSADNAGAILTPDTLARARAAGLDARRHLDAHDAWGFFAALGDLVVTGPTRTNVNDFRAILVEATAG